MKRKDLTIGMAVGDKTRPRMKLTVVMTAPRKKNPGYVSFATTEPYCFKHLPATRSGNGVLCRTDRGNEIVVLLPELVTELERVRLDEVRYQECLARDKARKELDALEDTVEDILEKLNISYTTSTRHTEKRVFYSINIYTMHSIVEHLKETGFELRPFRGLPEV